MQKPRLTDRTAEALTVAHAYLSSTWWADVEMDPKQSAQIKRAVEYLEDLLRWKRSRKA